MIMIPPKFPVIPGGPQHFNDCTVAMPATSCEVMGLTISLTKFAYFAPEKFTAFHSGASIYLCRCRYHCLTVLTSKNGVRIIKRWWSYLLSQHDHWVELLRMCVLSRLRTLVYILACTIPSRRSYRNFHSSRTQGRETTYMNRKS